MYLVFGGAALILVAPFTDFSNELDMMLTLVEVEPPLADMSVGVCDTILADWVWTGTIGDGGLGMEKKKMFKEVPQGN